MYRMGSVDLISCCEWSVWNACQVHLHGDCVQDQVVSDLWPVLVEGFLDRS